MPLALAAVGILLLAALLAGYLIGNVLLRKRVDSVVKELEQSGLIKGSIIDNVNLGVIAYGEEGALYSNQTIYEMPGFLGTSGSIPRDINAFLEAYDQNNHLKAGYLLNAENDDNIIRANYCTGRKIYEIKVLRRTLDKDRLDIVIVDDITQIKDDERRQKDLAANVSHELKTPLTVIRASEFFVNSISPDNVPGYEEIKKWGNRIVSNAVRMQDIVQDFLILSMCSASVPMSILDLNDIVGKAVNSIADYPGRDSVRINLPAAEAYPLIYGNPNLVMRVIINLLTNSVKYIDYEGKDQPHIINISIATIDDRVAVQVEDNGRGIPEESIDHLFERFYRVDNSGARDVGGSGIGLAIAKEVADMHSGTINVVSTLGQGSTFTFVLPSAQSVFENVYDDAITGVISDNQYYAGAADFMGLQAVEAVRSMGYDDAVNEAENYERSLSGEKTAHEKALAELLAKIGKERYEELVEELTYIDDEMFDDEPFDEEDEESGIEGDITSESDNGEDFQDETMSSADSEAEQIALQKEEARKILTQNILPRSPLYKNEEKKPESVKEMPRIHPNTPRKMYNSKSGKKKASLFEGFTVRKQKPEEPAIQSAVRKVLDETAPIVVTADKTAEDKGETT